MKYLFAIVVFNLISCASDSDSDLYNSILKDDITYTADVKPIITENCIMCHSQPPQNGAPISLTTYEQVKYAVEERGLISRISSNDAGFWMPFGGNRLPQNKIDLITEWSTTGLTE
ncbi:hypothetical protein [Flavobacterium sp.]|uniref:hypothetical protein n=1 Tax=Flavobacterium sp. TaxID=239 RepID=UPI0028BEDD90|nr:hypothetical protein [Flavobacterium sp.]